MASPSFARKYRLLKSSDFDGVFKDPVKVSHGALMFLVKSNNLDFARIGFSISKKNVSKAFRRNQLRRVVRESFRLNRQRLANLDIVVFVRRGYAFKDNTNVYEDSNKLWQRLNSLFDK